MQRTQSKLKAARRLRRRRHTRRRVSGSPDCPRMSVYRSLAHIYVQIVDDVGGRTLCSAGTRDKDLRDGISAAGNKDAAQAIGKAIGEKAKALGISSVVFDRNGFRYHGRVKALADAARKAGLEF